MEHEKPDPPSPLPTAPFLCEMCDKEYTTSPKNRKCLQCGRITVIANPWLEPNGKNKKISAVPSYVAELMRQQLAQFGVKDATTISQWQEKAEKLTPDEFLVEAKEFAAINPAFIITPLENYVQATKIETLDSQTVAKYEVGKEIINALLPSMEASKKNKKHQVIFSTSLDLSYEQTKRALREILPDYFNLSTNCNPDEILLPFVISKERCLEGQVISNLDGTKKSVTLLTAYSVSGEFVYQFFGETKPNDARKFAPFLRYNALFYVYKFQSDTSEDVYLLSSNELEISACKIYGMEANCYDFLKIGNIAKISTNQKIFFVHSQKPSIDKIDEDKFWKSAAKYADKDVLNEAYFGKYPHPEWFSSFIVAWSFAGKLGNMPTHLSLLSPPAQGKTRMLDNLGLVFGQSLNASGTLKGLVPSFANGIPKEGYLIRCKRFAFVDEFIHIIQNSSRNGSDFDGGSYQLLKVLEHSEGEHSSAFGIIKAKPKFWAIFCSNVRPQEHIKNLVDLHAKLNAAFMSRLLWYVFDEEHLKFISERKSEVMTFDDNALPKYNKALISMTDFLHSFTMKIPIKVVEDIHAKYRPFVPSNLELDIYDSRMIMHIYRMLDGYCKYKSVIQGRGRFICTPEDIKELDAIFGRIVRSWSINVDEKHLTPAMKLAYLNSAAREIFDFVEINQTTMIGGGVDENALTRLKGATALEIAEDLARKGIFKRIQNSSGVKIFYTYNTSI